MVEMIENRIIFSNFAQVFVLFGHPAENFPIKRARTGNGFYMRQFYTKREIN